MTETESSSLAFHVLGQSSACHSLAGQQTEFSLPIGFAMEDCDSEKRNLREADEESTSSIRVECCFACILVWVVCVPPTAVEGKLVNNADRKQSGDTTTSEEEFTDLKSLDGLVEESREEDEEWRHERDEGDEEWDRQLLERLITVTLHGHVLEHVLRVGTVVIRERDSEVAV